MSADPAQVVPSAVGAGQEATSGSIMGSSEPNRQAGGLGLQRTASKDMGATVPGAGMPGNFGKAPQGLGLQRTMSRDMGGNAQPQPVGGGLQRTMSKDLGGARSQPGGLQRTMSRDLGGAGAQPGGLQRTMSRDLDMGNAQPGGGGLQRTLSRGVGNVTSGSSHRTSRQPRKTPGVPRSAGGQDLLPRQSNSGT